MTSKPEGHVGVLICRERNRAERKGTRAVRRAASKRFCRLMLGAEVLMSCAFLAGADAAVAAPEDQGFVAGSHAGVRLRSYNDHLETEHQPTRNASVLGAQTFFESGYTPGELGLGADASLFSALSLYADKYSRNMAHVGGAEGWKQRGWAYPGLWDAKARLGSTVFKYGVLLTKDPFLVPHDNRALPPTFRGGTLDSQPSAGLSLSAGSFDRVIPRGDTHLRSLQTEYGRVPFNRISFLGGTYAAGPDAEASLNAARLEDVWDQYYLRVRRSVGDLAGIKWTGRADYYRTADSGAARSGRVNSNAFSLAISAEHEGHGLMVAYQRIASDQFFDYVGESAGDLLMNSMDVDYNAPHEQSVQLRYTLDMNRYGVPGLKFMLWGVKGWGADATDTASALRPGQAQYDLYWKDGKPVQGSHYEIGFIPSYVVGSGSLRQTTIALSIMHHVSDSSYSDPTSDIVRLVVNVPLTFL